ncbi:MAG TPA: methylated-DNA--[protein]-cysteine S-methyltransferase [Firmicutes bacterium]|nr:methylated-DNA--[protein]-cysteine S-methyltransferase [Bacillota bacterium]
MSEHVFNTSLGDAEARIGADGALQALRLLKPGHARRPDSSHAGARVAAVARQLEEYFSGERRRFDLELAPQGTPFQQAVWREVSRIPYGETTTYGELAGRLGSPGAVRAVGAANGANPLWIVIPCHRVIGADGTLTGYAAGIAVKRRLLELEGALPLSLFNRQI